jgi:phosphatidylglycerol:prolipoprotein diacylglycerol transferase
MTIDTIYLNTLNPIALDLSWTGLPIQIRWYGLAYLLGFYCTFLIAKRLTHKGRSPLTQAHITDYIFTAALGTILGGRLGYCLFYDPSLFFTLTSSPPFWGVLAIQNGGMASHGGIIGIMLATFYFARKHKSSFLHLLDIASIGSTIGVFFGRIANFINGELVGRITASPIAWGVRFPQDLYLWSLDRYQAITDSVVHCGISRERWLSFIDPQAPQYAAIHHTITIIMKRLAEGDLVLAHLIAPHIDIRHPSQLYEAFGEGLLLFLILSYVWRRARAPGVITATCLIVYSIVRVIGEQFRLPDAQIGYQIFGLTRGQILSSIPFILGFALVWFLKRQRSAVQYGPLFGK